MSFILVHSATAYAAYGSSTTSAQGWNRIRIDNWAIRWPSSELDQYLVAVSWNAVPRACYTTVCVGGVGWLVGGPGVFISLLLYLVLLFLTPVLSKPLINTRFQLWDCGRAGRPRPVYSDVVYSWLNHTYTVAVRLTGVLRIACSCCSLLCWLA